jgi:hypothetical protein
VPLPSFRRDQLAVMLGIAAGVALLVVVRLLVFFF